MRTVHKLVTSQMSFEKSVKNQGSKQSLVFISPIFHILYISDKYIRKGEEYTCLKYNYERVKL